MRSIAQLVLLLFICCGLHAQTRFDNSGLTVEGSLNFCGADTGTVNAYACANPTGATILAYHSGTYYSFQATHANTGSATLAIDGLAATTIKKQQGAATLASGDIANNALVTVQYDAVNSVFQLISAIGNASSGPSSAITVTNAGTTGTVVNTLTKLTGAPSTAVRAATTDVGGGIVGITSAGAGTTGSATILTSGSASCVFDAASVAGDYVQVSTTTAGDCHDAGAVFPAVNQVIGRVLVTNASAGTNLIDLFGAENQGTLGTYLTSLTNGVSRTTGSKLTDWISVKDFGVKGDGSTDDTTNIKNAIAACAAVGGCTLFFPAGTYVVSSVLNISTGNIQIRGDGHGSTVIQWTPTAAGTVFLFEGPLLCNTNTTPCSDIVKDSISDLDIYSADTTFAKTAIKVAAVSQFSLDGVGISGAGTNTTFSGSAGTRGIGLETQGHDASKIYKLTSQADKPISIEVNPLIYTGPIVLDMDQWHFMDLYLIANGFPCITIADGAVVTDDTFDGMQAWVFGTYGLYWSNTTQALASYGMRFENVRTEQGTSATSYSIYISSTDGQIQQTQINSLYGDPGRDFIYLRGTLYTTINQPIFAGTSSFVAMNADTTNFDLQVVGGTITGAGATFTGYIPTYAWGVGSGSNSTPTAVTTTGDDHTGTLAFTTSATPTASSVILTLNYGTSGRVSGPPVCMIGPANATTARLWTTTSQPFVSALNTQWFQISSNTTALTASVAYSFYYQCMKYFK